MGIKYLAKTVTITNTVVITCDTCGGGGYIHKNEGEAALSHKCHKCHRWFCESHINRGNDVNGLRMNVCDGCIGNLSHSAFREERHNDEDPYHGH